MVEMNVNTDRRIRRTKAILRKELTKLLTVKELKDITVKELTENSDVNRGTFYLHYKDIYDLFEQIENEVLKEFMSIIEKYKKQEQLSWKLIILDLLRYIITNIEFFEVILNKRDSTFLTKVIEINRPKNKKEWEKLFGGVKEEYYNYYYAFMTKGCVALIKSWLYSGMKQSPEQIAELAGSLMAGCINKI